jgi:flagellar FliJ protein
MGFHFRYESLLNYRQHLKEKAEVDLARARQRLRQSMEALEAYEEGLKQTREALEQNLKDSLPSHELQNYSDYFINLEERIGLAEMEVVDHERTVRQKMQVLLSKTKDFKAIEKLKEKDLKKWNHQQHINELKRLNEIGVIRHGKISL